MDAIIQTYRTHHSETTDARGTSNDDDGIIKLTELIKDC